MILIILGILLIIAGIVLAVFYKKPPTTNWNKKVSLGFGITFIVIGVILSGVGAYNHFSNN